MAGKPRVKHLWSQPIVVGRYIYRVDERNGWIFVIRPHRIKTRDGMKDYLKKYFRGTDSPSWKRVKRLEMVGLNRVVLPDPAPQPIQKPAPVRIKRKIELF